MADRINVGISTCLTGESVRYDGGHKLDHFLTDTLGQYVAYLPVCPEVEFGLSVPRESMRLIGKPDSPRLVTLKTKIDHTDRMLTWAARRVKELEKEELCGFIFKSKSPSSGMERVRVYSDTGMPAKTGIGLFARVFMEHYPLIPVEEDGRLHDPKLRENFIERIFALKRWRELRSQESRLGRLVEFHTLNKLLLLAHSETHYRTMGKLVARGKEMPIVKLYGEYERLLMEALRLKSTIRKNTNVLQHMMGYFKKQLSPDEKQEMLEIIDQYRQGHIPLIVPVTLIKHFVRKYQQSYLRNQSYLNPHPMALQLRNHA